MYVIGLTGNIASGKSTIAAMLARLGAFVLDADQLAHWAMRSGTDAHHRILMRFGPSFLAADGEIDRRALGALVFTESAALCDLEQIVHPAVVAETLRRLDSSDAAVGVIEAIKLLEASMRRYCDAVWVVTTSRATQIQRLVHTRSLTVVEAELRIDAQPPPELKVAQADIVIDNSGSLEETWGQVIRAWEAIPVHTSGTACP
jgi:dephospho-CoA kinase